MNKIENFFFSLVQLAGDSLLDVLTAEECKYLEVEEWLQIMSDGYENVHVIQCWTFSIIVCQMLLYMYILNIYQWLLKSPTEMLVGGSEL